MIAEDCIEHFKNYLISELNVSANTVDSYIRDVKQFVQHSQIQSLVDLKNEQITDFLHSLQNKMNEKTVARKSSSVMHFFKFLYRDGLIDFFPEKNWDKQFSKKTIPKVISHEQIINIIHYYREDDLRKSLIIALLYTTGVRVSEFIAIKKKDFFFNKECDIYFLRIFGKGSKERIVPVHDFAMDIVQEFLQQDLQNDSKWLFSHQKNHLTRQRISQILHEIHIDFSVKIHPHLLRHSFATHFLKQSQNIRMVQKALGHENLSSTQIYTHVEKSELKKNVFVKHPFAK